MIDILSLTDKNGKKVFDLTSERDDKRHYSLNSVALNFPNLQISFEKKFSFSHDWGADQGIDGELGADEYFNIEDFANVKLSVGDKFTNVGLGSYRENLDSEEEVQQRFDAHTVTEQDINRVLRMSMAYKYMTEHIQEKLANGKSRSELMGLPYMDVVQLEFSKKGIYRQYVKEIQQALKHDDYTEDRAQALLNETFGEGTVDLDQYIQSQVNELLAQREEIAQRKAESIFSIGNITVGFAKLLTPVRMIQKKISELGVKREFRRLAKREKEGSQWEIDRKADILEEQFNDIQ